MWFLTLFEENIYFNYNYDHNFNNLSFSVYTIRSKLILSAGNSAIEIPKSVAATPCDLSL